MARLRAVMEQKQTVFRQAASGSRLSVVTLRSTEPEQECGMTPALSDNFLRVAIAGVFPANQMLWTAVSHPIKDENGGAPALRVTQI
jgi:hypothetical protein